jgi:hypothetical protein
MALVAAMDGIGGWTNVHARGMVNDQPDTPVSDNPQVANGQMSVAVNVVR